VIIGDDSVMIVEAQATPRLAQKVIEKVREVTDKPISHGSLTHYHAVSVLGASAYRRRSGHHVGHGPRDGRRTRAGGLGQRVPTLSHAFSRATRASPV
jgi:glyoxylase-like metal-dependent hydrolase (beta-lactamase superfamily II)